MFDHHPRIAVIGLGAMGLPMATHLAATFPVTGFDPFAPRRELAAESGIKTVATPAAACSDADIALMAVRDHDQAETALFGPDGVLTTSAAKSGISTNMASQLNPTWARPTRHGLDAPAVH